MYRLLALVKQGVKALIASLKRFPESIAFAALTSAALIALVHLGPGTSSDTREILTRVAMTTALGIPLFLCIRLIFERAVGFGKAHYTAVSLLGIILLAAYYFLFLGDIDKMAQVSMYFAVNIALYLGFFFIPYLYRQEGFEIYVVKVLTRAFITSFFTAVLFLGLTALLFTANRLLNMPVTNKTYMTIWILATVLFAPSFFLGGIPGRDEKHQLEDYPNPLKVLLQYIVMPILSAYTAILYLYLVRIVVQQRWPVGMVAHLVLWYSVICAGVIFLTHPLARESKWVKSFAFWIVKLIPPVLAAMFVSIGIRIRAYGFTENRYYVVVLGLWVLGIMLYLNFSKKPNMTVLPVSLAIVALLSVFGPWSSFSVSKYSQNARLMKILSQYDMIKDGNIVKAKTAESIPVEDRAEISSILGYFDRYHGFDYVKLLPEGFTLDDMEKVFGFSYIYRGFITPDREFFNYGSYAVEQAINVEGYDYFFDMPGSRLEGKIAFGGIEATYDYSTSRLEITYNGRVEYETLLSDLAQELHEKYGSGRNISLDPEDLMLEGESKNLRVKVALRYIQGHVNEENKASVDSAEFYVFIDIKQ